MPFYNPQPSIKAGDVFFRGHAAVYANEAICDGTAISRTAYPQTFARYGVLYGPGDGATTFNLPDYRGRTLVGNDNGRGLDPARVFGSDQANQSNDVEAINTGIGSHPAGYQAVPFGTFSGFVETGDEGAPPNYGLQIKLYGRKTRSDNTSGHWIMVLG